MNAIEFDQVSKAYSIYASPADRVRELVSFGARPLHKTAYALRDVTFRVRRGEVFCVIGENGAGKSTLLELIAQISPPTAGSAVTNGRVSALLELGSGFNPEYTGRENVYLNAAVLGFSRKQIDARFESIAEFADIGDFIERPVKTYSSGMLVRLAFAVAIQTEPEILLVDEALAVGDFGFRQRCARKVHELRAKGVTIVFVSHAMAEVKSIGERALWLERGKVRRIGDVEPVVAAYVEAVTRRQALRPGGESPSPPGSQPRAVTTIPNIDHRFGDGRAEVLGIAIFGPENSPAFLEAGAPALVRISVRARADIARPVVGFAVRNHLGIEFAATETPREGCDLPPMAAGEVYTVDFELELPNLYPGAFSFSPAIGDGSLDAVCDWIDNAITVQVTGGGAPVYGYIHLPCRVEFNATAASEARVD